jgi:ferrous iron transport protein B
MGVQQDNWQASVGVVTGLVAKEAVVGTLNSLYGQDAAAGGGQAVPSVAAGLGAAVATIPANLATVPSSLIDPLGLRIVGGSQSSVAADVGASTSVFGHMRAGFSEGRPQAYAYLLFVLLYLPCVAAFGAMTKEMGLRYTMLALGYLAVTAWSVATLFYQVTVERDWVWIGVAAGLLAAQALVFWAIGRRARASAAGKTAPAQSPSAA